MKMWEVMLQWEAGDLVVIGVSLRPAPSAMLARVNARRWTAFFAKVATMDVKVLRVRRVLPAEELVLRRMGLPRPWATPKAEVFENPDQEEKV